MEPLRLGIVGLGVMGQDHLENALAQPDLIRVVATADPSAAARAAAEARNVPCVADIDELLARGVEAVVIATPHPRHEAAVLAAAGRGVHILCEKPLAATASAADRMLAACRRGRVTLAMDFQMRASPVYRTLRRLLQEEVIGDLARVGVVATSSYRTQAYYNQGSWRGTWEGEGGGVLMNQAPHTLDLYLWLAGQPLRVKASVETRVHHIEAENSASALLEHEGGRVDTYITSTAEFPGKTEWTFVGDRGTLVSDGKAIRLFRLEDSLSHQILSAPHRSRPRGAWEEVPLDPMAPEEMGHVGVLRQFAQAVRGGAAPLAGGEDGARALDLANAILLAGMRNQTVDVPVDREAYDRLLRELRQRDV